MNKLIACFLIYLTLTSCANKGYVHDRAPDYSKEEAKPTVIVTPRYPTAVAEKGIGGWVSFEFSLDDNGAPIEIEVKDSHPGDTFVEVATHAFKKWTFEKGEDGKANKRKYYVMEFRPY